MKRLNLLLTPLALSLLLVAITGCGVEGQVEERSYDVKVTSGADEAKALLENYSSGTPVGSEADGFDILITKIKEESPEQALSGRYECPGARQEHEGRAR